MDIKNLKSAALATACSFALVTASGLAIADDYVAQDAEEMREDTADAIEQVNESIAVLKEMQRDPQLAALLNQSEGVFIAADYGRAALGVGVRGGQGVLLMNENGSWSSPVFYDFGGISAGLQAGAEGGSLAMILNNQRALDNFKQKNNWSLNADAGLTVVNWSARAQASAGKGDVIVWSDAAGLMGDVAVSLSDIRYDQEDTSAFYGREVTLTEVFGGRIDSPHRIAGLDE